MEKPCLLRTTDGKGNRGKFKERFPNICAAGMHTTQPYENIPQNLQHYLLKDEADALIGDAIFPQTQKLKILPPIRHPPQLDMRNAGIYTEGGTLINPKEKTKFQNLVDEVKHTPFTSYWKKPLGRARDPVPMLPEGFKTQETTFGKPSDLSERLYDVIMPIKPLSDVSPSKRASFQTNRNYCKPAFNPNSCYGMKTHQDPCNSGKSAKCCLTYDNVVQGTSLAEPVNKLDADFKERYRSKLATALAPQDNRSLVPKGFRFGIIDPESDSVADCMTMCPTNLQRVFFRKCLAHLNTVRGVLYKRQNPSLYRNLYLKLKYMDKCKTGWIPKNMVYDLCATQFIRFDPSLIESLLLEWKAFDGERIEYKTFILLINYRQPLPEISKMWDIPKDFLDYSTTYSEMIRPGQEEDNGLRAGMPSGRYFDRDFPITPDYCTKADRFYLPEETDAKVCLGPSVFTNLGVTHRDMFAVREPKLVKKVFEAAGERFTDEEFKNVWNKAKKYHSEGCVCFETFRKVLHKANSKDKEEIS